MRGRKMVQKKLTSDLPENWDVGIGEHEGERAFGNTKTEREGQNKVSLRIQTITWR